MGKPSGGEREVNLGSNVVKRLTRNIRGKIIMFTSTIILIVMAWCLICCKVIFMPVEPSKAM